MNRDDTNNNFPRATADYRTAPQVQPFQARTLACTVFDQRSYLEPYRLDLESAQEQILIHSAFATSRGVARWASYIKDAVARGVSTCVFIQEPRDWKSRHDSRLAAEVRAKLDSLESALNLLVDLQAHVTMRPGVHEKITVIDGRIVWDGSLNTLSHFDTAERLSRWSDRSLAVDAIVRHRLDQCSQCSVFDAWPSFGEQHVERRVKQLGRVLADRRRELSLSQRALAELADISPNSISPFEGGQRNMQLPAAARAFGVMGLELAAVPRSLLPAVEYLVRQYTVNQLERRASSPGPVGMSPGGKDRSQRHSVPREGEELDELG